MAPAPAFLDGIGFSEMLVIAFIAILIFGGNLPDTLRNLGRSYAKFRKSLSDVSRPLRDEIQRATTLPPEPFHPALPANASPPAGPPPPPPPASGLEAPSAYLTGTPASAPAAPSEPAAPPEPPAPAPTAPRPAAPFDDEPPPV
jgi:Sec-independent protein translocase protein TatA